MIRLTLSGLVGFDGTYELDLDNSPLTNRELHWIKEIAGVRLGEFEQAADSGDNDLLVAFATISLIRSGKSRKDQQKMLTELLWDAAGGRITLEEVIDPESGDASPPELTSAEATSSSTSSESPPNSSSLSKHIGEVSPETSPDSIGVPS